MSTSNVYFHRYAIQAVSHRPPVVLIHGAGGTYLSWPPEIRRLPGWQIFALDLPGHGKAGGRGSQSIEGYTTAIMAWMREQSIGRAILVGHSMGSAIALSLAREYPYRVVGLGLVGAGARLRVAPALLQGIAGEATFADALDQVVAWSYGSQAPAELLRLARLRLGEVRPGVLHGDFLACDAFDMLDELKQVTAPAIVICGEEDRLTPLRYAQFLADQLPAASLKVIPNAGHMVMLEQPRATAQALVEFWQQRVEENPV